MIRSSSDSAIVRQQHMRKYAPNSNGVPATTRDTTTSVSSQVDLKPDNGFGTSTHGNSEESK